MATRMGAAGVRTGINDSSGYSLVESPRAIGAVVGFAPKGELNKICLLTNTAQQEDYFGLGFNNPRYNQGMYGARAVLSSGGHVEFVRPYGEEIDKTSDYKRDLKTDTFVVTYDRNAANNPENADCTSIGVHHFASTRYKVDGAAKFGVTRKINNIAETIVNNSNVDFNVDAAEDFTSRNNWISAGGVARGETDMVMFALMNADPSGANRAYSSYPVDTAMSARTGSGELTVLSKSKVGFAVDDIVYGPAEGRVSTMSTFRVTQIVDKTVYLEAADDQTKLNVDTYRYIPSVLMYSDTAGIVDDGSDYLSIKTAVSGKGAKTFSSLFLSPEGLEKLAALPSGTPIVFSSQDGGEVYVRLSTDVPSPGTVHENDTSLVVDIPTAKNSIWVGDTVLVKWSDKVATVAVTAINGTEFTLKAESGDSIAELAESASVNVLNESTGWADTEHTHTLYLDSESTVSSTVNALLDILHGEDLAYGNSMIVGDLLKKEGSIVKSEDGKTITLAPGGAIDFMPGDRVAITRASSETVQEAENVDLGDFDNSNILYFGMVKNSDPITDTVELVEAFGDGIETDYGEFQLLNLTQTNKTVYASISTVSNHSADKTVASGYTAEFDLKQVSVGGESVDPVYLVQAVEITADISDMPEGIAAGDTVTFECDELTDPVTGIVKTVDASSVVIRCDNINQEVPGTRDSDQDVAPTPTSTTLKVHVAADDTSKQVADIYFIGNFTVYVPEAIQNSTTAAALDETTVGISAGAAFKYAEPSNGCVIDHSEKVLTDSTIGATFVGLGLANIRYMDVNFTGKSERVYDLTDDGEAVSRLYMSIAYSYKGVRYEFDGTVVQYVYNDRQLYIGDTAERELEGSGVTFILNDSGVMEMFREDNSYDLSSTVAGVSTPHGIKPAPSGTMICPAFNIDDPAIIKNAVWKYDPKNNMSTSTLSNAVNLFLDKDESDLTFFVSAGLGVKNFGLRGYETLDTQFMQAVLNVCELRKDCFALFDGVDEKKIEKVLKLDSPASQFGSTLGRWGAIFDGRLVFHDTIITKTNVELAPSVAMASLITSNRKSIFWHVPAGVDTGRVPGAWCDRLKYKRKYNIPEDAESEIAKLSDLHVNAIRSNKKGIYYFGDFTMQMEDSAFDAINVTMLVAGIHKMFYDYLDAKVFQLNTPGLRSDITEDLQSKLDQIIAANPGGLETGSKVVCDDSNNPPEVVAAKRLNVDLMLYPTLSTRYIFLTTNVLSRANGNIVTTDIRTGER